jgi:hypothetical protein
VNTCLKNRYQIVEISIRDNPIENGLKECGSPKPGESEK